MSELEAFRRLVVRAREGDLQAAKTLVEQFSPHVRRVARVRLRMSPIKRQFDSVDISQSVLGDFFLRIALGQFDFESPGQLVKLLTTMAINKVKAHNRKFKTQKRDLGRQESHDVSEMAIVDHRPAPSVVAEQREILKLARKLLSDEELRLLEERRAGRPWSELAAELGTTADALRMRYNRAIDRVVQAIDEAGK
jgi:RNA polymerase sigma-70 factor (ECF subfamily)